MFTEFIASNRRVTGLMVMFAALMVLVVIFVKIDSANNLSTYDLIRQAEKRGFTCLSGWEHESLELVACSEPSLNIMVLSNEDEYDKALRTYYELKFTHEVLGGSKIHVEEYLVKGRYFAFSFDLSPAEMERLLSRGLFS